MNVLYVCQEFKKSHALGAIIRRAGIQAAFTRCGLEIHTLALPRRDRFVAEVFSVSGSKPNEAVTAAAQDSDAVFLEGLPVAVATIAAIRRRKPSGTIHVDVCDSWVRLSGAGAGAGSSLRGRTAKHLKLVLARLALRYVSRHADSVSYISPLDLESDDPYLSPATRRFVVPNGNPVNCSSEPVSWQRNGPMVVVGDWSYPPNQSMLRNVLDWYPSIDGRTHTAGLNIVGPNLAESVPSQSSISVLGWVDEIADAYAGVSCALALTTSGGGVKNKVLEPLSLGIPVIATQDALNGIAYDSSMVLLFDGGLSAVKVSAWLDSQSSPGGRALKAPSWDACISNLASYIVDGISS